MAEAQLQTIPDAKEAVQSYFSDQAWFLHCLRDGGWDSGIVPETSREWHSISLGDIHIMVDNLPKTSTSGITRNRIRVVLIVRDPVGKLHKVEELKYPATTEIHRALFRMERYCLEHHTTLDN